MKIDKTAIEEIAEMETMLAAKRAQLFADVVAFVEEHGIDKRALCAALLPKRPRAAKAPAPAPDEAK